MTSARLAACHQLEKLARAGRIERTIVIIGGGPRGSELITALERLRQPWTRILGVFDDRRRAGTPTRVMGYPVLGTTADLVAFTRRTRVDEIIIALPWSAELRVQEIINRIGEIPANINMGPDQIVQSSPNSRLVDLDGVPTLNVMAKPLSSGGWIIKGIEDFLIAGTALVLLSPLLLLIALAIKIDSPGPVFFRQKRCGFNNNLIEVFKFRSMYHHLADGNADKLATRNDPRVTRLGRFLRRSSLDELPQLFNVLRGEMSIVGPRPHALQAKADGKLYQSVVDNYAKRHKIKPGITGWAQVNGWRGETDTEDKIIRRVEFDLFYIENWSLSLDLYIVFMTAFALVGAKGAY
jgi:Undecaprenyl-phosphate glucose phosphotransferase